MRKSFTRLSSLLVLFLLGIAMFAGAASPTWTLSPKDNATVGSSQSEFVITFKNNVSQGTNGAAIGLYTSAGAPLRVFQIGTTSASGAAVFSGKTVTITFPGYTFKETSSYYITVANEAVATSNGETFGGIAANGWDFTIKDTGAPVVDAKAPYSPKVGAKDVSLTPTFSIKFAEQVKLKSGTLSLGDFAVYTSINGDDNEEGGDLVTLAVPNAGTVVTAPTVLSNTFTFSFAAALPDYRDLYVRVKPGIFVDASGNPYQGINDNNTWTFTTKAVGNFVPEITMENAKLATIDPFYIEMFKTPSTKTEFFTTSGTKITAANVDSKLSGSVSLTDQDGNAIAFKLELANNDSLKVIPKAALSGSKFTVAIDSAAVKDIDGNRNDDASKTFNAGDWTAPTFDMVTTNPSGTTFDIIVKNASEACKVKYIVTRPVPAELNGQTFDALFGDVLGEAEDGGNDSIFVKSKYIHTNRVAGTNTTWAYQVTYVDPADGKTKTTKIDIYAEDTISVTNPSLETLDRVTGLPETNGQDYVVWAVAWDSGSQGAFNPDYTDNGGAIAGHVNPNVVSADGMTIDILMPTVWFDADSAGFKKMLNSKKKDYTVVDVLDTMAKTAEIVLNFNEGVRMADGTAIDEDDIPTFLSVIDSTGGGSIAIGFSASISDDKKTITVVADSSYKSDATIVAAIDATEIEDLAGNEFQPAKDSLRMQKFLVETYNPVLAKFTPATDSIGFEGQTITIEFSKPVFVPADDETTAGTLAPMSNVSTDPLYVGEYVDITEGNGTAAGNGDVAVKDEFDFNISADNKKITITRSTGKWSSETFYYIEVEPSLLDEDRIALSVGDSVNTVSNRAKGFEAFTTGTPDNGAAGTTSALDDNHTIQFKYGDIVAPEITFFQEGISSIVPAYNFIDIDGSSTVVPGDRIGVYINEWVKLGFADEITVDTPSGKVIQPLAGNAFRRYFKLETGATGIEFDIEDITLLGDSLFFFIDPYYADASKTDGFDETTNFKAGVDYKVTYISTQNENNSGEAYEDDSDNKVEDEVVATFKGQAAASTPKVGVTITPTPWTEIASTTSKVVFEFDRLLSSAMITGGAPSIAFQDTNAANNTNIPGTILAGFQKVEYTLPAMVDDSIYQIVVADNAFTFDATTAMWPAPAGANADSTWRYTTADKTAPDTIFAGLTPADDSVGVYTNTDLMMVFDEAVKPVLGKKIWVWENGVTQIAQIDAINVEIDWNKAASGDTIVIKNAWLSAMKWSQNYHVIVEKGAFVDMDGNEFLGFYDETDWNFTTGTDPAPYYTKFAPKTETKNTATALTVTFSEEVRGVDNKFIRLYDDAKLDSVVHTWEVDEDLSSTGWAKSFSFTPDVGDLVWGKTYTVAIDSAAFVDRQGDYVGYAVESTSTQATDPDSTAGGGVAYWSFTIQDLTAPKTTFWPADKDIQIPYNAYLYIQFDEKIALDNGAAIISDPNTVAAHIADFITLNDGSVDVATKVEFVDDAKQTLRITPLDPKGHDYTASNTDNATMQTETMYNLAISAGPVNGRTIVDQYGNSITSTSVNFTTEDITGPGITHVSTTATASKVEVKWSLDEMGKAYVYVIPTPKNHPSYATIVANAQDVVEIKKAADVGATKTSKISVTNGTGAVSYTAYIAAHDDEVDKYASPDPSLWIFTSTNDGIDRIRDILPASSNTASLIPAASVLTCDDDAPFIADFYPKHMGDEVALDSTIYLILNEAIELGTKAPNAITLRKSKNNAAVATASITTPAGVNGKTDSILVKLNGTTSMLEETWYYLEIDRYAVVDSNNCGGANYMAEWVGKENLSFLTEDNTAPRFDSVYPYGTYTTQCVPTDIDEIRFAFTDINGLVNVGDGDDGIMIYQEVTTGNPGVLSEIIPMTSDLVTVVDDEYIAVDVSGHIFLPNDSVRIVLPGGVVADTKGNKHASSHVAAFRTIDNVPPVATWTILQDEVYFNQSNSQTDVGVFSKWTKFKSGSAGASVAEAPTHMAIKIDFDEDLQIKASGEWLDLNTAFDASLLDTKKKDGKLSPAELFDVFKVGDLVYRKDSAKSQLWVYDVQNMSITIGVDTITSQVHIEAGNDASGTFLTDEYVGSLLSETAYDVTVAAGMISDPLGCTNNRIVNDYTDIVSLVTRDDTPPMLTISSCAKDACVSKDGAIVLSFDKPVVKSSYDIKWLGHESYSADNLMLSASDLTQTDGSTYLKLWDNGKAAKVAVDVNIIDNKTIEITPKSALTSKGSYTIELNRWTVKEYIENDPNGTVFEGEGCTFTVEDYVAPKVAVVGSVLQLTPKDDRVAPADTLISASTKELKIVFDEGIYLGTGTLEIRRENGQIFEEIDAADCSIQMDSKKANWHTELTIPFQEHATLEDFTEYYVVMPAGFVTDTADCGVNDFAGFGASLDASTGMYVDGGWNFKTSDKTPPELLSNALGEMVGLYPAPGSVDIDKYTNLRMTFDEPVSINANPNGGIVIYYDNGDDTEADFGNAVEFIPWGSTKITQTHTDVYNNMLNDIIVVDPSTVFDRKGTYYVRVTGDSIVDGSMNSWSSSEVIALDEVKDEEWKFTITNDVVPVLIATTPDYDPVAAPTTYEALPAMDEGYVVADLSMKFGYKEGSSYVDLDVDKNTDDAMKVRIYEYVYDPASLAWNDRLWKEYPITDDSIVVEGNMVTIKGVVLRDDMQGDSVYYVTVDAGAITNGNTGSNNWWPGIANGFRWRFQTAADNVFLAGGPAIVSPEIGAVDLTQDNDLVVTFGEGIEALAMPYGMVKVYDADADSVAVAVTVDQSMTEGNTLTVPVTLYDESNFYVVLEEGAFGDTSTNSTPNPVFFADSSWSFATGDNTAPMATITPVDGAACLENEVTLTLSYENENNGVDLGAGLVTVTDTAGVEIAGVVVGAAMVDTTDASMVTVVLSNLPDVTDVLVSIEEGFVADPAGNLSVAVADYLLSIGDNTKPTVAITVPTATVTVDTTVLELTFSEPVNVATLMGTVMVNGEAVEVTSTDSLVYTAVLDTVVSDAANVVVVDADAFVDNGCNALGNDSVSLTFDVADITAPTAMYAPTGVYEGDYMNFELIITFDDMVEAAAGDVVVYDAATDEALDTIAVEDFATLDSISFTAVTEALSYGSFYVMVPAGSFIDPTAAEMGKEYMGTADATDWAFEIVDSEFDNCYDIISPVDGETGVATTTDLVIEFCSERIVAGAGNVYLADLASDAGDIVIPADSLVVEGMTLTIPVANLEEGVTYTVTIEPGTITDEAGNAFMGIVDGDEWNFTTEDATAPMVTLVAGTSMEGDAAEASITSTELGTVYLVAEGTALDAAALAAAVDAGTGVAAAVSFAGEAVMVDVSGLEDGKYIAVAVDLAGNLSEASTEVYEITEKPVIPVVAISAIQGTGDESPLLGQEVITSGVVTSKDAYGYYIQDANAAWSGVYVYDADNAAILNAGSAVKVQGTVDEYNGLTELKDVVSIDPILMDLKVEAIEVSAIDESYESVRIMISGQAPATATTAFKETATVGDFAVYFGMYADEASYDWKQDYTYKVTGIAKAYNDNWQVQPYFASDIENYSLTIGVLDLSSSIEVYPNPFNEFISIEVSSEVELTKAVITNIAGQIVKEVINPENTIRTQELRNGYYFISLHTEEGIVKSQRLMKR